MTSLEVQLHDKERVSVFLDGEFAFGLPILEASQLRKGQELSDDEIARLRAVDEVARAVDRAAQLLARRPYSSAEIRRNLTSKGIPSETIDAALQRLEDLGYVDDRVFAAYWIENRERFKPRGPRALRSELRQKGVGDELIDAALDSVDAAGSARRAAESQARRLRGTDRAAFRAKLGGFLSRRGFDFDTTRDVLDQLIQELEDEDADYFDTDEQDEE